MGTIASAIRQELSAADQEIVKMAKEGLDILEANAEEILGNFKTEVEETYKNPEEFEKWQVVGGLMEAEASFVSVATADTPSTDLTNAMQSFVEGLFATSDDQSHEDFKNGATGLVKGALNAFLGASRGGKSTMKKWFIIPHVVSFYRVDVCIYKYNLETQGFKDHYESQTVVFAAKGLLNASTFTADELLGFASEMFQTVEEITKFLEDFKKLHDLAQGVVQKTSNATKAQMHQVPHVLPPVTEATATAGSVDSADPADGEAEAEKLPRLLGRAVQGAEGAQGVQGVQGGPVQKLTPLAQPRTARALFADLKAGHGCHMTTAEKQAILSRLPQKFVLGGSLACRFADSSPAASAQASCFFC